MAFQETNVPLENVLDDIATTTTSSSIFRSLDLVVKLLADRPQRLNVVVGARLREKDVQNNVLQVNQAPVIAGVV